MLYLLGLNHRSAPLEVRESFYFPETQLSTVLRDLVSEPSVTEAMIISTCNRTEVIAAAEGEPQAAAAISRFIERHRPAHAKDLDSHAYRLADMDAVRHVFRVASSLDSMIVGEPQILGQVKAAYAAAREAGTVGGSISILMQRAFTCAKRVRSETQIARNPVSIAYAAAELAEKIFGALEGRSILVLGAGKMGSLATKHLIRKGVKTIHVANRTFGEGLKLADEIGGEAISFESFPDYLRRVDVVVVSTAAPAYVLDEAEARRVMKVRRHRPLFVVDLSVPRNVDPKLNDLDNIFLYNVDNLQGVAEAGMSERMQEATRAEALVKDEMEGYARRIRTDEVKPTIVDLRRRFQEVASSEVEKIRMKLGPLSTEQAKALEEGIGGLVNKLLHAPSAELKKALDARNGYHLVQLTRRLFRLESSPAPGDRQAEPPEGAPEEAGDDAAAPEKGRHASKGATGR